MPTTECFIALHAKLLPKRRRRTANGAAKPPSSASENINRIPPIDPFHPSFIEYGAVGTSSYQGKKRALLPPLQADSLRNTIDRDVSTISFPS